MRLTAHRKRLSRVTSADWTLPEFRDACLRARLAATTSGLAQTVYATGDPDGPFEHKAFGAETDWRWLQSSRATWQPVVTMLPEQFNGPGWN